MPLGPGLPELGRSVACGVETSRESSPGAGSFATTRWTVVLTAAETRAPGAEAALAVLCERYWAPLYGFIRRTGRGAEEAQDLVQAFFLHLLENRVVAGADRRRGRFRTYLLGCLTNFLAKDHRRSTALKRGGAFHFVPLDEEPSDGHGSFAAPADWSPERAFDVGWAEAVVARALKVLRDEAAARGKERWFTELREFLSGEERAGEAEPESYREIAGRLGIPEATLKTTIRRLRLRFREIVRAEVARTVDSPEDVDAELRHLREMLVFARQGG